MKRIHDYDHACERYLLGELSELEQTQLEEAYFADGALFERLRAVKDDLIDAYARGNLTGQKRRRFEQHFLASEPRRQRVEEAKEFIRTVSAHSTNPSTASTDDLGRRSDTGWRQFISETFTLRRWVWQGTFAALLLIAFGSWLVVRRFQAERAEVVPQVNENSTDLAGNKPDLNSSGPPANSTTTPAPDRTPQPRTADNQPPQPAQVASLFLSPFSPRDATASKSLVLRPDTSAVRLHLAFKGDGYRSYEVVVRTLDGKQVLSRRGLRATAGAMGKSVTITVDPSIFRHQDYIITLSGLTADRKLEALGDYYFRVEEPHLNQ